MIRGLPKNVPGVSNRPLIRHVARNQFSAAARTFIGTFSAWLVTRSVTRSALEAQFPGTDLASTWIEYANRLSNYLRLSSVRDAGERKRIVDDLSDYLAPGSIRWRPLLTPPDRVAPARYASYVLADATLAEALLLRKNVIVVGLLDAHAAGFSTRSRDLVDDLLPFVG